MCVWEFLKDIFIIPVCVWVVHFVYRWFGKPDIIFADCIAKKFIDGIPEYTIKYINIGKRDILECSRIVKLKIKTKDTPAGREKDAAAHISVGDTDVVPAIYGYGAGALKSVVADLHINMHEFTRSARYSDEIVNKAKEGTLRLDEVLSRYGDKNTVIEVHILGNDRFDGRRMHFTHTYTLSSDIKDGEFTPTDKYIRKQYTWLKRCYNKLTGRLTKKISKMISKLRP